MSNKYYQNNYKKETEVVTNEIVTEPIVEETELVEEQSVILEGKVVNCAKLNVRKEPSFDADKITQVSKDAILRVEKLDNNDKWLKAWTEAGVEGYVCAEYILVSVVE